MAYTVCWVVETLSLYSRYFPVPTTTENDSTPPTIGPGRMVGAAAMGCTFGTVSPGRAMYSGIGVGVLVSPWLKNDSLTIFQSLVSLPANCSRHRLPCRSPM